VDYANDAAIGAWRASWTWKVHGTVNSSLDAALLLLLLPAAVPAADPLHLRANAALIVLSMVVPGFCYSAVACGEQRPLCLSRLGTVFSAGLLSLSCRLLSTEAQE